MAPPVSFRPASDTLVPFKYRFDSNGTFIPKLNIKHSSRSKYLVSIDGSVWPNDHLVPFEPRRCHHGPFCKCSQSNYHSVYESKSLASNCPDNVTLPLCFQMLDLLSLACCRTVNRRWREQSNNPLSYQSNVYSITRNEQWRQEAIRISSSETKHSSFLTINNDFVSSLLSSFPHLRSIDFSKLPHQPHKLTERSLSLISRLPALTDLSMNQCNQAVTDRSLLFLTTRLTKLRSLSIDHCDQLTNQSLLYLSTSRFVNTLINLSMNGCSRITDLTCLKDIKLQSIHLSNTSRLFAHSFVALHHVTSFTSFSLASTHITSHSFKQSFAGSLKSIRQLDLSGCADLNDDVMLTLISMSQLTNLNLRDCSHLSSHAWHRCLITGQKFRSLRNLDVSSTCLDDASFSCIPKAAPYLQIVSINQCSSITSLSCLKTCHSLHTINANLCHSLVDLHGLSHLKHLVILRLWDCFMLNDTSLLPILSSCSSLIKLNVCSCRGLTDQTASRWCDPKCLPALQVLNIRFCEGVSESSKHLLKQARHNLQVIG